MGELKSSSAIQSEIRGKVSEQIIVQDEGQGRFRVFTPFKFSDGDHLAIVLNENKDRFRKFIKDELTAGKD